MQPPCLYASHVWAPVDEPSREEKKDHASSMSNASQTFEKGGAMTTTPGGGCRAVSSALASRLSRTDFGIMGNICTHGCLGLDRIRALEHVVNVFKIVGAGEDGGDFALGLVVLLKVGLLPEVAHLMWLLAK